MTLESFGQQVLVTIFLYFNLKRKPIFTKNVQHVWFPCRICSRFFLKNTYLYIFQTILLSHKKWAIEKTYISFTCFSEKKNSSPQKIYFFLPFFNATFQCRRYNVFNFFFFFPQKVEKTTPKSCS